MKLTIKGVDVKGKCQVYEIKDKIVPKQGYILDPEETDTACMNAIASTLPYYIDLSKGIEAKDLGRSREGSKKADMQCL